MRTSRVAFISIASVIAAAFVAKKLNTNVPGLN